MTALDRLEGALERLVEGSAGRIFRSRLQPAEIGRRLERAMADGVVVGVDGAIAPNRFAVALHPDDFAPVASASGALGEDFARWLEDRAAERGWILIDRAAVTLGADLAAPRRQCLVTAEIAATDGAPARRLSPASDAEGPLRLLVLAGPQRGQELLAPAPTATIGRGRDNAVVLLHDSVSRRHARIEAAAGSRRLVDLGSTNGTWRNGARVDEAPLRPGDELRFGTVAVRVLAHGVGG